MRFDKGDHSPRFGRRGQTWLTARLRGVFAAAIATEAGDAFSLRVRSRIDLHWEDRTQRLRLAKRLASWYAEQPLVYVQWLPTDDYRGKGFSAGAWTVQWSTILRDLCEGLAACREREAQVQAEQFDSLDAWLLADLAGRFGEPSSSGGDSRLDETQRQRLAFSAYDRRSRWPRACRSCGESFMRRGNKQRCDECILSTKTAKPGGRVRRESKVSPAAAPLPVE